MTIPSEKNQVDDRLFVPLNKRWYDLFQEGKKLWEIRAVSPRFNHKTVYTGRTVELRRGYAIKGALWGKIIDVAEMRDIYNLPEKILTEALPIDKSEKNLWNEIDRYNNKYDQFIVFKVKLFIGELTYVERHHLIASVSENKELLQELSKQ
jgi:hypothetical protein